MMGSAVSKILAACVLATTAVLPMSASAQSQESRHRQQTKNTWRNVGIGAAALGVLGLVEKNNTLALAGAGGALYSAYRYEQDRKSQSKTDRARASLYSKKSFYKNGHRYVRHTTWKHGKKYYYFARG